MSLLRESIIEARLEKRVQAVADAVNENAAELIRAAAYCDAAGDCGAQVGLETILGALQSWMEASENFFKDIEAL